MTRLVAVALILLGAIAAMLAVQGLPWRSTPVAAPSPPAATPLEAAPPAPATPAPEPAPPETPLARLERVVTLSAPDTGQTDPAQDLTRQALRQLQRPGPAPTGARPASPPAPVASAPEASDMAQLTRQVLRGLQQPVSTAPLTVAVRQALRHPVADAYVQTLLREAARAPRTAPPAAVPLERRLADLVARSQAGQAGTPRTHRVGPGDTLGLLAEAYYGRASAWVDIYEANRDKLSNPESIRTGMTLRLPDLP